MANRRITLIALATTALTLGACSKQDPKAAEPATNASSIDKAKAYDATAASAKGFNAGALMSAHTVYVLFDPQCPHCSHLWEASKPLQSKLKFVWAPVSLLGPKSLPQGAALLQEANPVEAMTLHEKSLLAGTGGTAASASVPADVDASIKANTELLNRLGAESVPFIVGRHVGSGQVVTHAGSMGTEALATLLGVTP